MGKSELTLAKCGLLAETGRGTGGCPVGPLPMVWIATGRWISLSSASLLPARDDEPARRNIPDSLPLRLVLLERISPAMLRSESDPWI